MMILFFNNHRKRLTTWALPRGASVYYGYFPLDNDVVQMANKTALLA